MILVCTVEGRNPSNFWFAFWEKRWPHKLILNLTDLQHPWIMTFKFKNNLYFSFLFRLLLRTSGKLCMPQKLCRTPKVLCFYVRLPMFLAGNWIMVELLWCGVEAVLFDPFFWETSRRLMKKIPSWTIFSWTISSKTLFMRPNLHGERFVNLIFLDLKCRLGSGYNNF